MRINSFLEASQTIFTNSTFYLGIYSDIFLIIVILLLLLYFVFIDFISKYKFISYTLITQISIICVLILTMLIFNESYLTFYNFSFLLNNTFFNNSVKKLIIFFFIMLLLLSINYFKFEQVFKFEYYILVFLSLLGLFIIINSYDLISMYLGIELQSLCFYILATFKPYNNFSGEAGLKYFILGAFSSGMLLFGCSLLYGITGLTNFYELELFFQIMDNSYFLNSLIISIFFILIGLFFKLSAAPFHMWAIDVYEGSPTLVTAFFSIIPKIGILTLLLKFFFFLFNLYWNYFNQFILISIFLSLIIGTFSALLQVKLKRILAYSGVTHVGFLLLGLSINTIEGFYSVFFYIVIYMLLSLTLFSIILSIYKWNTYLKIKHISEVILLFKGNSILSFLFGLTLFSIAGIPPLIGFYSKFYVFVAAIQVKYYFLVLVAALISVISTIYYIRLIKLMFFKNINYYLFFKPIPIQNTLIISFFFLFNIFFFYLIFFFYYDQIFVF